MTPPRIAPVCRGRRVAAILVYGFYGLVLEVTRSRAHESGLLGRIEKITAVPKSCLVLGRSEGPAHSNFS